VLAAFAERSLIETPIGAAVDVGAELHVVR
jgi:hypothetical protein